ncbi:5-(carboxyamino)imidazole ribonucleotide mutase [Gordonia desulfuricans]|nr:5-(carboxyamino)imidazole ribonucleotide mutase [Gordonia desulfuricans]
MPGITDSTGTTSGDDAAGAADHVLKARVGLIMGSDSDWPTMQLAAEALAEFGIPFEVGVVSAHRTPQRMLDYATAAAENGIEVIIAGAGGAAHLPGMVAAATPLPVIGVPVPLRHLDGLDSLLSIVQMPAGVPVATVSVGGARNAGLLAVRILGAADPALRARMESFQRGLEQMVLEKDAALRAKLLGD